MKNISLGRERKSLNKLTKKLDKIEFEHDKNKIQSELDTKIQSSAIKLNKVLKNLNPSRIKEIHRFRILAKKLRYQGECINSLTNSPKYDLANLKHIQSVAGKIQNESMLLKTLDRFLLNEKNRDNTKLLKFKKRIEGHQMKLIKQELNHLFEIKWEN